MLVYIYAFDNDILIILFSIDLHFGAVHISHSLRGASSELIMLAVPAALLKEQSRQVLDFLFFISGSTD